MKNTDTKLVSSRAASAARLSVACGLLFVLLLGSLHVLEPEFDPTWRFISEYALGSVGWMMKLAFLALALSLACAGVAIFSQARTIVGYLGLAVLGIAAIGMLIAGIFTTDPETASHNAEAASFSGSMHVLGASLDYTPVAALVLSFVLARNPSWRPIRTGLFITASITLVALAAFMVVLPYDGRVGPGVVAGLFGRFLLLSYLGWLVVVDLHVIKLRNLQRVDQRIPAARGSVGAVQGAQHG